MGGGGLVTGARGEGQLEVDGKVYEILFTNKALADAEKATGKTVLQLANEARAQATGMGDTAQLLYIGIETARRENRSGGKSYSLMDAWRIMDALGFAAVLTVVLEAMTDVLSYGTGSAEDEEPDPQS